MAFPVDVSNPSISSINLVGFWNWVLPCNNWDDGSHGHQTAWLLEMVYGFGFTTSFARQSLRSPPVPWTLRMLRLLCPGTSWDGDGPRIRRRGWRVDPGFGVRNRHLWPYITNMYTYIYIYIITITIIIIRMILGPGLVIIIISYNIISYNIIWYIVSYII